MKIILLISLFFNILSCDTVEEEYLYKKTDAQYLWLQEMAAQDCINAANVFDALDAAGDFLNLGIENKIYKVVQDQATLTTLYIKITKVTATAVELTVNSRDTQYQKVLNFEKSDHDNLLGKLKVLACDASLNANFSATGLDSNDLMTLTWKKETIITVDNEDEGTEPQSYKRRTDVLAFDNDLPLIFYFYNASKSSKHLAESTAEDPKTPTEVKSILTLSEVTTANECTSTLEVACNFSDTAAFPRCNISDNTSVPKENPYDAELFLLSVDGGGTCKMLTSANQ